LRVPWPVAQIDPHALDDGAAAIFGNALFEPLYGSDDGQTTIPVLAEADAEVIGSSTRVALRAGIRTGLGRPIEAREVLASIARARAAGAKAWLSDIPVPRADGARAIVFAGMKDAPRVMRALASPLTAIVASGFSPERPDGTGPFAASRIADGLVLRRSASAAGGPAMLDEVSVHAAADLTASLSAFEGGVDDVGWLGLGVHEPRTGARAFDAGMVAWAVLRTGRGAGRRGAPGGAQRVADGISPSRLSYLGVGAAWPLAPEDGWGGAPCEVVVRDDCPWLVELARAVAGSLTRAGHEVGAKLLPAAEIAQRRASRAYALCMDVVRPLAPGTLGAQVALATADNAAAAGDLVGFPSKGADPSPRTMTRTLRLGVVGEVRVQGGRAAGVALATLPGQGLDFGSSTRAKNP
jgi:peptide/nickel transport system substrate-binding protein